DLGLRAYAQAELGRERLGGGVSALQVAAVERVEGLLDRGHACGQLSGLFASGGVEFDVLPALQAAFVVPGGFAVTNKPDFSHASVGSRDEMRIASSLQVCGRSGLTVLPISALAPKLRPPINLFLSEYRGFHVQLLFSTVETGRRYCAW